MRTATDSYYVRTRGGRTGSIPRQTKFGDGSLDVGKREFERIFATKTGLKWSERGAEAVDGMSVFLPFTYLGDDDYPAVAVKSILDDRVQEALRLFLDPTALQAAVGTSSYNDKELPFKKLDDTVIVQAQSLLTRIESGLQSSSVQAKKDHLDLQDKYYSIIPHNFGHKSPPYLGADSITKECALLQSLKDIRLSTDIIEKSNRRNPESSHPVDRQFAALRLSEFQPGEFL